MDWKDDFEEVAGERQKPRHPKTPEGFPYESAERKAWATARANEMAAAEAQGNFEGKMGETAPVASATAWMDQFEAPGAVGGDWRSMFEEEQTGLMSLRGGGSLLRQIGPRITRGILGMQLRDLEAIQASRLAGKPQMGDVGEDLTPKILEKQLAIAEADRALETIRGNPTKPLEVAQDIVGSVAENAPGIATAVTSRNIGPAAGAPALAQAYQSASGQAYAGYRGGEKPQTQDVEQAQIAAHGAGVSEVGFELLPMSYLIKNLGKTGVVDFVKGYMVRELGTELGTTAATKVTEWSTIEQDKPVGDFLAELKDELIHTGLVTMGAGPITSIGAHTMVRAGRLGRQRPDEPVETPGRVDPIAEQPLSTNMGADGTDQSAPRADLPTNELPAEAQAQLEAQALARDPEEIDDKRLEEAKSRFEATKQKQQAPDIPDAKLVWSQVDTAPTTAVEDAAEFGASPRQASNAANYINPNQGDRLDWKITYGPEEAIGLSPRQHMPKADTYVIGQPSDDRPADWLAGGRDTIEWLRQKYLPKATFVLSNEQLYNGSMLGWHHTTGVGKHLIVPAVLRKPSRGWGEYNPNTIATAYYNLTHEFGHAFIADKFFEGVSDQVAGAIREASKHGLVPQELLNQLPPAQAAIVQEFNSMKQRILDETMTAQEFIDGWLGPAKAGRKTFLETLGVSPKAPAKQLINAIVSQAKANSNVKANDAAAALQQQAIEEYLSFDEYAAEQFARHAYQKEWDQKSPIAKLFGNILSGLRGIFMDSKRHGLIAPGTAFRDWMEGIGKTARPLEEKAALVERKKTQKGTSKVPRTTKAKRQVKKDGKIEKVQHNVESDTHVEREQSARGMVVALVRGKAIERGDPQYSDLMGFANRGEFEEFSELYTKLSGKTISWDKSKKGKTSAEMDVTTEKDWEGGKFTSSGFKVFFGDWERDPQGASKIRVGAFKQDRMGIISLDDESVSPPLVLFSTLERLSQGQNAFHASTPRGQQYVESRSMDSPEDLTLVPVVLNVRKPFIQGEFHTPAPSRQELEAQGYDGIVYQNDYDGDLSFIVFKPTQIKVVPDRSPYSSTPGFHAELDTDQSTQQGHAMTKFFRSIKNFVADPEQLKRSLKHTLQGMRFIMQLQQIAQKNPEVTEATFMMRANTEYTSYDASRLHIPNKILDYWSDMPNKAYEAVSKFLIAQAESGQRWFDLARTTKLVQGRVTPWYEVQVSQLTLKKAREHGIDPDSDRGRELLTHLRNIENSLLDFLNENERIILNLLALRYGHDIQQFNDAADTLKREIHDLRKTPFLPRKWFGKYLVTLSEKAVVGYEVIHKEAYDHAWQRDAAFEKLQQRKKPTQILQKDTLSDTQYVLMGLPKNFLDTVGTELGLEADQIRKLSEILQPVKQEKLLREHDLKLMGITGYSQDVMRNYAAYTFHQAKLQAKMLYRKQFNMAIGKLRREVEDLSYSNHPDYYRKQGILWAMEGTRDYIMHPPNELHTVRAFVSLIYLMGNVKTAVTNSLGLMLTWADITARHGSHKGELRFYQAVYRNAAAVWAKESLPQDIQKGLARAQEEGVLDQTFAYHAAGMANSNRLWRALSRRRVIRYLQKDIDLAMMPFRLVELFTRRITFLAALQEGLERKDIKGNKIGFNEAYQAAVQKVNHLQNDYTAGNRIPLMRGKLSAVTVFMSFPQHAGFQGLGQYEAGQRALIRHEIKEGLRPESDRPTKMQLLHGHTVRTWALLFMLAGFQGLPFADNLLDIAEWIWRRYGKRPIRHELRDMIQSIEGEPHLWMRGLSHNVAGLDLSKSAGWGQLLPGTQLLSKAQKDNFDEQVGTVSLDLAGVTGHTMKWMYEMTPLSDKPFEKVMRSAPGLGGNMWNAYEWGKYGVRGPAGGLILKDPKTGQMRDLTSFELWAKAMGFNATRVSEQREVNYEVYDRTVYWKTRRDRMKDAIWRGVMQGDKEYETEAREAVKEFNTWLGNDPEWRMLRIDNAEIQRFLLAKRQAQRREEMQRPADRRFRGLHQDIRRLYDRPDEEGMP